MLFIFSLVIKSKRMNKHGNNILVIMEDSGVGDTVVSMHALYNLKLNLPSGCNLYIAAPKTVIQFLKSCKSTFNAHFIELNFKKKYEQEAYIQNHRGLSSQKWRYIIAFNRIGTYLKLLLLGCNYCEILCSEYFKFPCSYFEKVLSFILPNYKQYYFRLEESILEVYKKMVKNILDKFYNTDYKFIFKNYSIPLLTQNPLSNIKGKYCLICSSISNEHSQPYRAWPLERFAEISNFIIQNSDYKICLCGTKEDIENNEMLENKIIDTGRILNLTGKTNFKEWIEIIRDSKFVFGNDSGYIHIAAILNVKSYVIAGYWNYGRFLPYPKSQKGMAAPIDIRSNFVPCYYCMSRSLHDKYKKLCDKTIQEHGVYKCIFDISCDQVKKKMLKTGLI